MLSFVAGAAAVTLVVWLRLWLGRGGFWRVDGENLPPPPGSGLERWPGISVVIPARNEAEVLPRTLPTLLGQSYPGSLHVFLVDDHSGDGTSEAARAAAADLPHSGRLTVLSGRALAPGWTGKLWAMEQGLEAARATNSRYYLLTDADVAYGERSIRDLVEHAETHALDLVSHMVRLRADSVWERLLIPAFVYFFAMIYPFAWARDPERRTAAAAGGCILLRADALDRAGGLAPMAGALIDDCALARRVKDAGGRIWLGFTNRESSLRAYGPLGDIWSMVARTAFAQLGYSYAVLVGTVLGMLLVFVVPPACALGGLVGALHGEAPALWTGVALAGFASWAVMTRTYLPLARFYDTNPASTVCLPFTAALYTLMTVDSARRFGRGQGGLWKGRTYEATAPAARRGPPR